MRKQKPRKIIKKKQYQRSKWDDFNKVKATFVLKQFNQNISKYIELVQNHGYNPESVTTSPLTRWFLSLPKTQGRSQQIVRLAFIHNYGYTFGKGTEIGSFKNNKNTYFNEYLKMESDLNIGIDKINLERQKHRAILRYTTEKVIRDYISKTNQRKPSKRARFTKKDIKEDEREEYFMELQKFFNQLVREPTKEEIAQEYEDPEEIDEFQKEYISQNEFVQDDVDSSEEDIQINPEVRGDMSIQALMNFSLGKYQNSAQIISELIKQYDQVSQSEDESIYCIPSPLQSKKSFSLSQFDASPPLSVAQSEDESQKAEQQVPNRVKKSLSEDSQRPMLKKVCSMNLCMTDQQFEQYQRQVAWRRREEDLSDEIGL